ncbi:MAG: hypothetical protein ACPG51_19920 [Thiolinea sp.]
MNKQHPAPKIPAAHMAMYGKPADDLNTRITNLFSQLSDSNQDRFLTFVEAMVNGDQATVDRLKQEIETELAYLDHRAAGGEA